MVKVLALGALAGASLGCIVGGSAAPSKPLVEFPTQARLAAVEAQPAALPPVAGGAVPAEGWTVDAGRVPPSAPSGAAAAAAPEPWTPQTAWEQAFAASYAASARKATLTRAMACVAGEMGRYTLAHQAPPPEPLQRFFAGACGVFAPTFGYLSIAGKTPAQASDDDVLAHWKQQLQPDLVAQLPPNAKTIGFWFGKQQGRAAAFVVFEASPVELQPVALQPDANGDITIEGRLEGDADYFAGYANQGRFGVASCLVDPGIPRPRFRITCRMAPDDATAWFQIVYAAPRSVLGHPLVHVLARRDATAPLKFVAEAYGPARPVADAAAFGPAVVAGLNGARAEAGLPLVKLADGQSAAAARLARQYFAAALGKTGIGDLVPGALDAMNTIALGLLAGWQVTGTIRDGTFVSVVVPRTRDAGRWLDAALAMPIGRQALLARDLDEVALGPALFDRPEAIGAVACGYRFHKSDDHSADVNALHERVARARANLKLTAPTRLLGMEGVIRRHMTHLQKQDGWNPLAVLKASLSEGVHKFGAGMRGYVIEASALDAFEIPPEIIKQPALKLEIAVTHYKPPGAAWAQLVIVVVYQSGATVEI